MADSWGYNYNLTITPEISKEQWKEIREKADQQHMEWDLFCLYEYLGKTYLSPSEGLSSSVENVARQLEYTIKTYIPKGHKVNGKLELIEKKIMDLIQKWEKF
jgi:hypothetical protein